MGTIYFHYSLELALVWNAVTVDIRRVAPSDILGVRDGVGIAVFNYLKIRSKKVSDSVDTTGLVR
ncbi:MAG: hypothetical protein B6244_01490 [Candidatus Cloacimonetes bacterium 4572_55]|nr:MAG: hypothetical protein B6244_01490 [Candidatus Cloacimonetes bacterium 4572_55]